MLVLTGCGLGGPTVIVYTSQDEVYAEQIFKDFEKDTGIRVEAVYDSEAVKTVGLVKRLLEEAGHPQCDVFWNNEELHTRQLAAANIFRETNAWVKLGYRSRRMLINTNLLSPANAPRVFSEATNETWRGKVAIAYPLSGTTTAHLLALRQRWGDTQWQAWCRTLMANGPKVVEGNSVAAGLVGRGESWIGFADSDDVAEEQSDGKPVIPLPLNDESLIIFNTAAVVRSAPHTAEAQQFFDYLQKKEVSQKLVDAHALEGATADSAGSLPGLKPDWDAMLRDLDSASEELKQIFTR